VVARNQTTDRRNKAAKFKNQSVKIELQKFSARGELGPQGRERVGKKGGRGGDYSSAAAQTSGSAQAKFSRPGRTRGVGRVRKVSRKIKIIKLFFL
jgi:hypothetical protein